jgi:hypothetical protein
LRTAGVFQQLVAGQHPLRPLDEGPEQRELAAGEVDHGALGRAQLVADQVEPPAGEFAGRVQTLVAARLASPAQHRPHPGQQFARIAGLGHIVVRAQFEADDPVGLLAHGRQHDDRRSVRPGELSADGQAVLAGQHHVQHDQIDRAPGQHPLHLLAVAGGLDLVAVPLEELGNHIADARVVVDHQDLFRHFGALGRHFGCRLHVDEAGVRLWRTNVPLATAT